MAFRFHPESQTAQTSNHITAEQWPLNNHLSDLERSEDKLIAKQRSRFRCSARLSELP